MSQQITEEENGRLWDEFDRYQDARNYAELDLNAALDCFIGRGDLSLEQIQDRMAGLIGSVIEARAVVNGTC